MTSEYRFSDIAESLQKGFMADEIVLALAHAEAGSPLSPSERELLTKAANVLESAVAGYHWVDNPQLTHDTRTFANSFGTAVNALRQVYTSDAFLQQVADLKGTADQLSRGELPEKQKIRALREFFFSAARCELDRTEELLSGDTSTDAAQWTTSIAA